MVIVTTCYLEPDIHDRHSLVSQHLVNSSGGGSRVGSSRASSRSSHAHSQVISISRVGLSRSSHAHSQVKSKVGIQQIQMKIIQPLSDSSRFSPQYFSHQELPLSPPEEFRVVSELLPRHTQVSQVPQPSCDVSWGTLSHPG